MLYYVPVVDILISPSDLYELLTAPPSEQGQSSHLDNVFHFPEESAINEAIVKQFTNHQRLSFVKILVKRLLDILISAKENYEIIQLKDQELCT